MVHSMYMGEKRFITKILRPKKMSRHKMIEEFVGVYLKDRMCERLKWKGRL